MKRNGGDLQFAPALLHLHVQVRYHSLLALEMHCQIRIDFPLVFLRFIKNTHRMPMANK